MPITLPACHNGKLANSTIAPYVEIVACIQGEVEKRLAEVHLAEMHSR